MRDLDSYLQEQHRAHLYRVRQAVESAQGPELAVDGRRYLAFCSNDYLGLASHPAVVAALQEAAGRWGVGSGASHLVCGHQRPHQALEEELAAFTRRPRALLFSTGYMANLGVVSALVGRGQTVFEDRLNHASLLDAALLAGARLRRYPHVDAAALERRCEAARKPAKLFLTDGVFSMDGDLAPLPGLARAARRHGAWLLVDDAHAFGVVGPQGRGTTARFGLGVDDVPILVGTLGKAFGTFGAFVAGSDALIETLIQRARSYIYTTALPPAIAAATRVSLRLLRTEDWRRQHLHALIQRLRSGAAELGLPLLPSETPIQPLLVGHAQRALQVSADLRARGILVTAIRPPTVPQGSARLRITLSAQHAEVHVDRLLGALAETVASPGSEDTAADESMQG